MKIIALLFLVISFQGISQVAYNTSAQAAQFICQDQSSIEFNIVDQHGCVVTRVGGQFKVYFYYRALSSHVTVPDPSLFTIDASVDCSVKVWGGYVSKDAAVAEYTSDTTIAEYTQTSSAITVAHDLNAGKTYLMEVIIYNCSAEFSIDALQPSWLNNDYKEEECIGCITGFRPTTGNYVLSAWVKDAGASLGTVSYSQPFIQITSNSITTYCTASGDIIDGWQRIEKEFVMGDEDPTIELVCGAEGDCYFDDIRIFPKDASMVTYVYDPLTLRLMAELDERNYAKIYEYDEQGKLIRVKKETEVGVMTIQENRENNSKE